uniref:CRAL-TRIO domain-containing protein n=1 Tax=Megaselia scalaris TaxID=36166 RepID=T1GYI5_MEGSC
MDGQRARDIQSLLKERIVLLTGGRDRRGGPILSFPSNSKRERLKPEDLRRLLTYLIMIPSDSAKNLRFTVIMDMRGNGNCATNVKTILKVLQEHFSANIHNVVLIKPDNFWQKQRTSISSHKYKFETTTISIDSLNKIAEPNQLSSDFEGMQLYDHEQWIDSRIAIEEFFWHASDLVDRIDDLQEDLNRNDIAENVHGAKERLDYNKEMRKKIEKLPIKELTVEAEKLIFKYSNYQQSQENGSTSRHIPIQANNPDTENALKKASRQLDVIRNGQQHLFSLWQAKDARLSQCFQLRLFEQDCEKMFDWILRNQDTFRANYVEIGMNYAMAKKLQDEHQKFAEASMNVAVNIDRITDVAARLIESQHYAADHIKTLSQRLSIIGSTGLKERSNVLQLSVLFHHKAEQYCNNVNSWAGACLASQQLPTDIKSLEGLIPNHKSLLPTISEAYSDVHSTSKTLLYQLDHLVQVCNQPPPNGVAAYNENMVYQNPAADYSEGASHVLEEDVRQVLDWLKNHGEVFLMKNTGIGRNLQKAKIYKKSHEHFENVAQNTYSNAEKLLNAADNLVGNGEADPDEIFEVAREMEVKVRSFAEQVEQRRRRLDMAVIFYTHEAK